MVWISSPGKSTYRPDDVVDFIFGKGEYDLSVYSLIDTDGEIRRGLLDLDDVEDALKVAMISPPGGADLEIFSSLPLESHVLRGWVLACGIGTERDTEAAWEEFRMGDGFFTELEDSKSAALLHPFLSRCILSDEYSTSDLAELMSRYLDADDGFLRDIYGHALGMYLERNGSLQVINDFVDTISISDLDDSVKLRLYLSASSQVSLLRDVPYDKEESDLLGAVEGFLHEISPSIAYTTISANTYLATGPVSAAHLLYRMSDPIQSERLVSALQFSSDMVFRRWINTGQCTACPAEMEEEARELSENLIGRRSGDGLVDRALRGDPEAAYAVSCDRILHSDQKEHPEGLDTWVSERFRREMHFMRLSARLGNPDAQLAYGLMFREGVYEKTDQSAFFRWVEDAARSGDPWACGYAGYLCEINGRESLSEEWFRLGALQGDGYSRSRLPPLENKSDSSGVLSFRNKSSYVGHVKKIKASADYRPTVPMAKRKGMTMHSKPLKVHAECSSLPNPPDIPGLREVLQRRDR